MLSFFSEFVHSKSFLAQYNIPTAIDNALVVLIEYWLIFKMDRAVWRGRFDEAYTVHEDYQIENRRR